MNKALSFVTMWLECILKIWQRKDNLPFVYLCSCLCAWVLFVLLALASLVYIKPSKANRLICEVNFIIHPYNVCSRNWDDEI
jgi:hypothetical protein